MLQHTHCKIISSKQEISYKITPLLFNDSRYFKLRQEFNFYSSAPFDGLPVHADTYSYSVSVQVCAGIPVRTASPR